MAKAKKKEFILKGGNLSYHHLNYTNGKFALSLRCQLLAFYGIKPKPSEKKRVRITIEEVK